MNKNNNKLIITISDANNKNGIAYDYNINENNSKQLALSFNNINKHSPINIDNIIEEALLTILLDRFKEHNSLSPNDDRYNDIWVLLKRAIIILNDR